jgi:hypothetical protein
MTMLRSVKKCGRLICLILSSVFAVSLVSPPAAAEPDNKLLPGGFLTRWDPGIPGGIPEADDFHTILRPGRNDAHRINTAIQEAGDAASAGNIQVVYLTEGTYNVSGTIVLDRSYVILRGAGPDKTVIRGGNTGSTVGIAIGPRTKASFAGAAAVGVSGDIRTGDKQLTVEDASGFSAGDILMLDRLADDNGDPNGASGGTEWLRNGQYFIRSRGGGAYGPPSEEGVRPVSQFIEIESVSGNTLHIKNVINIDFPAALKPQVWNTNAADNRYIGLEDMKLEYVASDKFGDGDNWEFNEAVVKFQLNTSYCWVKNIESDGSVMRGGLGFKGKHIEMHGYRNTISGSYVHSSADNRPGGNGYGIQIHGTDGLIENNIADKLCKPILGYATGGGNVIAYNYVPNTETGAWNGRTPEPISWSETAIDSSHQGYSHSDLYEGNYAVNISTDSTSGNNGWMVFFRNHAWGRNLDQSLPQTPGDNLRAMEVQGWNNEHVSIGNVWLTPESVNLPHGTAVWSVPHDRNTDKMAVYSVGNMAWNRETGGGGGFGAWDGGWAFEKLYVHYDYNYVTGGLIKDSSNTAPLPYSLYLDKAPAFFEGFTWPPVDPDGADSAGRVGDLPAKARYEGRLVNPPGAAPPGTLIPPASEKAPPPEESPPAGEEPPAQPEPPPAENKPIRLPLMLALGAGALFLLCGAAVIWGSMKK